VNNTCGGAVDPTDAGGSGSAVTHCADTDLGSQLGSAVASGTLTSADGDDSHKCFGFGSPDRGFAWTAPLAGSFTFDLCGSAPQWDSVLSVYDSTCTGVTLGCDDDSCDTSFHAKLKLTLTAGQSIVIVVDGNDDAGSYVLGINMN
jgi:hypothetical protein